MIEQQLSERFHTVFEDEPPLGFDPDQLVDDQRRGRRRRHAAVVGAVLSVAAAAAVGVVALSGTEQREPLRPAEPTAEPGPSTDPSAGTITFETFEARLGGTQEVTPDPSVYEVTPPNDPRLPGQRLDIDSFLVDSYPGDRGVLQIRRGDEVLFEVALGDHDKYAMQLAQPWQFTSEAPLQLAVSCHVAGAPGATCEAGVTFVGSAIT